MARGSIEIRYDRRMFSVTGATHFPDRKGLEPGDRVEVRLTCTVRSLPTPTLAKDGKWELNTVLEAYDGRVVKVLDRQPPAKVRTRKATP